MVGDEVKVAFCGGNPDGGLGTNVSLIVDAIEAVYDVQVVLGSIKSNGLRVRLRRR